MAKTRYARYKFQVRRGQLMASGQKRTMRGTIYDKNRVWITLDDKSASAMKKAIEIAVVDLNQAA